MSASDKGGETAGGSAGAGRRVDDFIFGNIGAAQENPLMELPVEKFQVKGFGKAGAVLCAGARGGRGRCANGGA